MEPEELVTLLKLFYVDARNVEGKPYSPNTAKAIRSGLDRFLSGSPQRKPFPLSGIKCLNRQTKPLMPRSKILRDMG